MVRFSKFASPFKIVTAALVVAIATIGQSESPFSEAPAGFDNQSNGVSTQDVHDADRLVFSEVDTAEKGLGPVFNGTSCAGCHSAPVTGGPGSTAEVRAGHYDNDVFINPTVTINNGTDVIANRSLINTFATCPEAQEQVPSTETIVTNRMTVNTLGDGFVEAIDDSTLKAIAQAQKRQTRGQIQGQVVMVDVLESPGTQRVGRFGWKDQQASLLSFAADAYLNEQGITSRLLPQDVTSVCDPPALADPEDVTGPDGLSDIDEFARFMRSTKVPPLDADIAATPDAKAGALLFELTGCSECHVSTLKTAPPGTVINGGTFTVPPALGNKIIHPYSDFLLHDVGTGDSIVQNGGEDTANKVRTAPLWGLRTHTVYMHDGQSKKLYDAITRHKGEASGVTARFYALPSAQREQILKFLSSL